MKRNAECIEEEIENLLLNCQHVILLSKTTNYPREITKVILSPETLEKKRSEEILVTAAKLNCVERKTYPRNYMSF